MLNVILYHKKPHLVDILTGVIHFIELDNEFGVEIFNPETGKEEHITRSNTTYDKYEVYENGKIIYISGDRSATI